MKKFTSIIFVAIMLLATSASIDAKELTQAFNSEGVISSEDDKNGDFVTIKVRENAFVEMDKSFNDSSVVITATSNDIVTYDSIDVTKMPYPKNVTITRDSPSFPKSIVYEEYNSTAKGWFKGTLNFSSSKYSGGKYVATYFGMMVYNPNK